MSRKRQDSHLLCGRMDSNELPRWCWELVSAKFIWSHFHAKIYNCWRSSGFYCFKYFICIFSWRTGTMELNHLCLIQEEGYFISCQNQEGCGWNMSMARDWHASTEMPRDCLTVLKKLHKSTRPSASIILVETIADGARNETIFHLREDSYRKNLVNLGEQLLQNYNNIRRPTIIWKVGHKLKFFLLHSY